MQLWDSPPVRNRKWIALIFYVAWSSFNTVIRYGVSLECGVFLGWRNSGIGAKELNATVTTSFTWIDGSFKSDIERKKLNRTAGAIVELFNIFQAMESTRLSPGFYEPSSLKGKGFIVHELGGFTVWRQVPARKCWRRPAKRRRRADRLSNRTGRRSAGRRRWRRDRRPLRRGRRRCRRRSAVGASRPTRTAASPRRSPSPSDCLKTASQAFGSFIVQWRYATHCTAVISGADRITAPTALFFNAITPPAHRISYVRLVRLKWRWWCLFFYSNCTRLRSVNH